MFREFSFPFKAPDKDEIGDMFSAMPTPEADLVVPSVIISPHTPAKHIATDIP